MITLTSYEILGITSLFLLVLSLSAVIIQIHAESYEKRSIERQDELLKKMQAFQDWTFNSLYEINPNVLAPDSIIEEKEETKCKVYTPSEDGYSEFKGDLDDWIT